MYEAVYSARKGILDEKDLPTKAVRVLGKQTKQRINTAIADIYANSYGKDAVGMSDEVAEATGLLRKFMFERVYGLVNKTIQERSERMLTQLFAYFMAHVDKLPAAYLRHLERDGKERIVCDYISGMTDNYAISVFEGIFIPTTFSLGGIRP